jgi:hypothetical protein
VLLTHPEKGNAIVDFDHMPKKELTSNVNGHELLHRDTQRPFIIFDRYGFTFLGNQNGLMRIENQRKEIEE